MPRPTKPRRICQIPSTVIFKPCHKGEVVEDIVVMTLDEYETIRLMDELGFTQEECAMQMDVARTTVQSIYESARKKIACCLVNSKTLLIEGGTYDICTHSQICCGKNCKKQQCESKCCNKLKKINEMEDDNMKIAVTYNNGEVFQHFGHSEKFKIYEVNEKKVVSSKVVDTNGSGHGALAGFLKELGVNTLICGGIGGGAKTALAEAGIEIFPGVKGETDKSVEELLAGKLIYNPDTKCSHHHEGGEHSCGNHDHSCGNH